MAHAGPRQPAPLAPMRVPKASDVLAADLRERILNGEYAEGSGLPTERELMAQTRMSRTTVREALRILEVQGLVSMRTGRMGGAFAQQPGEEVMSNTVGLLVRGQRLRLGALLETREAIEPYAARLAALNRDDADLAILEQLTRLGADSGNDVEAYLHAHIEWHIAVARAGHNELLAGVMIGLSRAIHADSRSDPSILDASLRETAIKAHEGVMDAIRRRDGEGAFQRMARHVHAHTDAVRGAGPHDDGAA
ncbi:FadR/GntR family transcriptional regulator [Microbacterium aurum]